LGLSSRLTQIHRREMRELGMTLLTRSSVNLLISMCYHSMSIWPVFGGMTLECGARGPEPLRSGAVH